METLRTTEYGREDIVVVEGKLVYEKKYIYIWFEKYFLSKTLPLGS